MVPLRWPWRTLPVSVLFLMLCVSTPVMRSPAREPLNWLPTTGESPSHVQADLKLQSSTKRTRSLRLARERLAVCVRTHMKLLLLSLAMYMYIVIHTPPSLPLPLSPSLPLPSLPLYLPSSLSLLSSLSSSLSSPLFIFAVCTFQ